jgi:hypothetical protein
MAEAEAKTLHMQTGGKGLTLERLRDIINTEFCKPFVMEVDISADFLDAEEIKDGMFEGKTLRIQIGPRDVEIDENGYVVAAGTMLGDYRNF